MLETLMTTARYRVASYGQLNHYLTFIDYVDRQYTYKEVVVDPNQCYRFAGNLYGLFKEIGVEEGMYVYTLYVNGFSNPLTYDGTKNVFKIPKRPPIPQD